MEQEEEIFNSLQLNDNPNHEAHDLESVAVSSTLSIAKLKALQQLSISDDSPFNFHQKTNLTQEELNCMRENKANELRRETDQLREQLRLVKSKLDELNRTKCDSQQEEAPQSAESLSKAAKDGEGNLCKRDELRRKEVAIQTILNEDEDKKKSLRPLTGKSDCPNCSCDRRRQSVCDNCFRVTPPEQGPNVSKSVDPRRPSFIWRNRQTDEDESKQSQKGVRKANPTAILMNSDDMRPIRPAAKYRTTAKETDLSFEPKVEVQVDHSVVPNSVYTIGKSLNEKRTKLARAIEELQLMVDKVEQRGNRLEEERKVAQLYKQQWRYGPAIGGRLGTQQRNYASRLDPSLARDTNSLLGFQHIEPSMRLRQYPTPAARSHRQPATGPRAKPRFSKLSAQTLASKAKMVNNTPRAGSLSNGQRSKSIESLHTIKARRQNDKDEKKKSPANDDVRTSFIETRVLNHNDFSSAKSASESNLSLPANGTDADAEEVVEEDLEEVINDESEDRGATAINVDQNKPHRADHDSCPKNEGPSDKEPIGQEEETTEATMVHEEKVKKMTWIPVFGETEIKTVTKRTPKRKLGIISSPSGSAGSRKTTNGLDKQRQEAKVSILRNSESSQTRNKSVTQDRVLNEARKKLHFASNLLEQERQDSLSRNQLSIRRTIPAPQPLPRSINKNGSTCRANRAASPGRARISANISQPPRNGRQLRPPIKTTPRGVPESNRSEEHSQTERVSSNSYAQEEEAHVTDATREISRLEAMIGEQQRLLLQLSHQREGNHNNQHSADNVCPCHCCSTARTSVKTPWSSRSYSPLPAHCQPEISESPPLSQQASHRTNLVHSLKERLSRTKTKLAKKLEEERAKHQILEQKVNSSLRKQSDLESENEILKKSLNKCIDTCLQDISSTFESLSDTMNEDSSVATGNHEHDSTASILDATSSSVAPIHSSMGSLMNAAQLISDNRHLKRMKSYIESIESQRRAIFEELNNEKQRSQKLELELTMSKEELEKLLRAKLELESQLSASNDLEKATTSVSSDKLQQIADNEPEPSTSGLCAHRQSELDDQVVVTVSRTSDEPSSHSDDAQAQTKNTSETEESSSYNSIDVYRQYIQSLSPDLSAIRRERQMILNEFDSIKRILIDMEK